MDIHIYLQERKKRVDAALARMLPREMDYPPSLCKAIRYSVLEGGKRIRPILAMAAFDASGGRGDSILPFACALEFIHAYSLVHDDLPAMDNDDLRRGKPTVHRVFGEAVAILVGDALLTEAFRTMSQGALDHGVDAEVAIGIINEVSLGAGFSGLVGGQVVDIESEGRDVDLPTLEYIHSHKTGALIVTSLRTGARLAGAAPEELRAITLYGEKLGLAFQIIDDVLNVVGDSERLGKKVGTDAARKKATYPGLLGTEESRRLANEIIGEGIAHLALFQDRAEPLKEIARYLASRIS
ncbi:MAG: polyprenyl synthetase family protein [Deltaproteobacteria bacterium]|nr:polyprenyl synthetase family protein [Deltaproteobacteria bacterium]MBW2122905.1 polyprenyl synthetase family protein [Deltaproteobacteria bacterium]